MRLSRHLIWRQFRARPRLTVSVCIGAVVALALPRWLALPTVVPCARAAWLSSPVWPCSIQAVLSVAVRDSTVQSAIELIAASASPLKPMVPTDSKSCNDAILLVAWRFRAMCSWSRGMPMPSSSTTIARTPPASKRRVMCVAPASSALSSSSRTTEAGRSTASPAAIWLISSSGSSRMVRGRGGAFKMAFTP
jgi:hypothetical protein